MQTNTTADGYVTAFTNHDREILEVVVRGFAPLLPSEPPQPKLGSKFLWERLVAQTCVMGSAERLDRMSEEERRAVWDAASLEQWQARGFSLQYMTRQLQAATRFPNKAAQRLRELAKTPTVVEDGAKVIVLRGLRKGSDSEFMRQQLLERFKGLLGLKSVSNFMLATGLSQDVLALDQRLVGFFRNYLGYERKLPQVQRSLPIYRSVEDALRPLCASQEITLGQFDHMIFNCASISSARYLIARYAPLAAAER